MYISTCGVVTTIAPSGLRDLIFSITAICSSLVPRKYKYMFISMYVCM